MPNKLWQGVLARLKKRRLAAWCVSYIAAAWILLQASELLWGIFDWPQNGLRILTILLFFGFFIAVTLAWFHGERGGQRVTAAEVIGIATILLIAAATLKYGRLTAPPEADRETANLFAGKASKRLTANSYHETSPSWAPESDSLVFASERSGNGDLWMRQRSGSMTQLTDHPADDAQPAWSPDGRSILFVSSREHADKLDHSVFYGYTFGGDIWSMPAFGGAAKKLVDDAYNPSWSPDGRFFAFDSSRGGPRRIWSAQADGQVVSQVSQDRSDLAVHIRPSWSPSGDWIVYERQPGTQATAAALVVASADGKTAFALTDDTQRNMAPAWADATTIVYASDRGGAINLWQISVDLERQKPLGAPVQLTLGAGEDFDPAIASDGSLAYITQRRLQNLWQLAVDPATLEFDQQPQRIMSASWNDIAPAVAPDNSALVFSSDRDGKSDIWLLPAGSDTPRQLTDRDGEDLQAVWSPDGERLAFFSDENGNNDIWVMSVAGGPPVAVTPPESNDINPYWSPDGTQFGFTSDRSGRSEIWKMNVDGSGATRLSDIGTLGHTARWSPDAEWLLFTSLAEGDRDVWAVAKDGSELRRLTTAPTQDAHGLWSPDGQTVLYLSDHQKVFATGFDDDEHRLLFDLGEIIDYVHLSADGRTFVFTRMQVESDIWLME